MTDVLALLRPLDEIESTMAAIYTRLAELNADDREAVSLFHRLARDERNHAAQVGYARRMAVQNPNAFTQVAIDLLPVQEILADLQSLRGAIEGLSLGEAVGALLRLEQTAAEAHARPAVAEAAGPLAGVLAGLQHGDERHARALADFARKRGYAAAARDAGSPPPL